MPSRERDDIVQMLRALPRGTVSTENVHTLREQLDAMTGQLPRGTRVDPAVGLSVRADWVRCGDTHDEHRLLYLHGGAYIAGSRRSHGPLAARISRASRCAVLLLEYRLAPEHPHPAALEDALVALAWMRNHGPSGPAPASSVFVGGDSAGGGLTLATLIATRDRDEPMPDAAITLSAWTDLAMTGESLETRRAVDPMIDPALMPAAAALYLGRTNARSPLASPLYGEPHGLPRMLMQVGDDEVLLDDTLRFAERARAAGVDVTADVWPAMFHVFQLFAGMLPEGREAIGRLGEFLAAPAARAT